MVKYSWKLYKDICDRLAQGELLKHVVKDVNITRWTFNEWSKKDEEHLEYYNNVLEMQLQEQEDSLIECGDIRAVDEEGKFCKIMADQLRRKIQVLSLNIGRRRAVINRRNEEKVETPEIRVMSYKKPEIVVNK